MNNQVNKELVKQEEKEVVYKVGNEDIRLTMNMVNQFIVKGQELNPKETVGFMQLCKYRKLNPFVGEAYPVKFGNEAAQMIVGFEAFKRKAEENPAYEGHRAGVIVMRGKECMELEGAFKLPQDVLVGGWAEIAVKGKKYPVVQKVCFSEYNKGKSTWKQIPCTMIRKVALVQALREAFPTDLGALYTSEELGVDNSNLNIKDDVEVQDTIIEAKEEAAVEIKEEANQEVIDIPSEEVKEESSDGIQQEF